MASAISSPTEQLDGVQSASGDAKPVYIHKVQEGKSVSPLLEFEFAKCKCILCGSLKIMYDKDNRFQLIGSII